MFLYDWSRASRGDLVLLRHAINAEWPITHANAAALMRAMGALLGTASATDEARRAIAVARVYLAAERANVREARSDSDRLA